MTFDPKSVLSFGIKNIHPSGIRKFFDIAAEMDDVISLSIGEPDFQTPWHIREEGINSLKNILVKIQGYSLKNKLCFLYDPRDRA